MKRGIEIWSDYDKTDQWCLRLRKKKGRFTLDEIQEVLREYELDFYFVFLDACNDPDDGGPEKPGDYVTVYRAEDFIRRDT